MNAISARQTPCIGVCSTGIGDIVCRGCKRFAHEIIDWNRYVPAQRRAVMARLQDLLDQVIRPKIVVTDRQKLLMHIDYQQIAHGAGQSSLGLVYALLRVGANQIEDPNHFGFRVNPPWRQYSLVSLKQRIDEDFYTLSCAHYERFIQPAPRVLTRSPSR